MATNRAIEQRLDKEKQERLVQIYQRPGMENN
jgi:hypothetical protein